MSYTVTFQNPAVGTVVRTFGTREEAEARVRHYAEKYGAFAGYVPARIDPE